MAWQRLPICFELLSPLHVGFLPNQPGTVVARTRCYVPGKNLWGAITANVTPEIYPEPAAVHFREIGDAIRREMMFSYCYLSDGRQLFVPNYSEDGLVWGWLPAGEHMPDRTFRSCFVGSRVSTALSDDGGALDASLHEIEFVRHRLGTPGQRSMSVLLVGALWIRVGATIGGRPLELHNAAVLLRDMDVLYGVVVGGERNYGFGRLRSVPPPAKLRALVEDLWPEDPSRGLQTRSQRPLPAHTPYRADQSFRGEIEILSGREYPTDQDGDGFRGVGARIASMGYCFAPGTRLQGNHQSLSLDPWGQLVWEHVS